MNLNNKRCTLHIKEISIQETSEKVAKIIKFQEAKDVNSLVENNTECTIPELCQLFNKNSPYFRLRSTLNFNNMNITVTNSLGDIRFEIKDKKKVSEKEIYSKVESFFSMIKLLENQNKKTSHLSNKLRSCLKKARHILQCPKESPVNIASFLLRIKEVYNEYNSLAMLTEKNKLENDSTCSSFNDELLLLKKLSPMISKIDTALQYVLNDAELTKTNKSLDTLKELLTQLSAKLKFNINNLNNSYDSILCGIITNKITDLQQNNIALQKMLHAHKQLSYNNRYLYTNPSQEKIQKIFSFSEEIGTFLNSCVEQNNKTIKDSGFEDNINKEGIQQYNQLVIDVLSLLQKTKSLETTINKHFQAIERSRKLLIQYNHLANTQKTINTDSPAIVMSECMNIVRYKDKKEQRLKFLIENEITLRSNKILQKIIKYKTREIQRKLQETFKCYGFSEINILHEDTKRLCSFADSIKLIQESVSSKS
jgi:hypothetical protein